MKERPFKHIFSKTFGFDFAWFAFGVDVSLAEIGGGFRTPAVVFGRQLKIAEHAKKSFLVIYTMELLILKAYLLNLMYSEKLLSFLLFTTKPTGHTKQHNLTENNS